jgi:hypothetical protein
MTDFDHRTTTDNWAEIDYDRDRWFLMPLAFKGTKWLDAAEWAYENACDRFLRGGRTLTKKVVKKEVLPFAERLVRAHHEAAGHIAGHMLYLHCPDYTKVPLLLAVGLWKTMGTWEEATQYYLYWGTKTATTTPVTDWITTENLGTGVRAYWHGEFKGPYDQVSYIFRNEAFATDVHAFVMAGDHDRFVEALPDLDRFMHGIRCIPSTIGKS